MSTVSVKNLTTDYIIFSLQIFKKTLLQQECEDNYVSP